MRLPKNTLKPLSEFTGIKARIISEYISQRMKPGASRAFILEDACKKIGVHIPARLWVEGPSKEIKKRLSQPSCTSVQKAKKSRIVSETAPENQAGAKQKG